MILKRLLHLSIVQRRIAFGMRPKLNFSTKQLQHPPTGAQKIDQVTEIIQQAIQEAQANTKAKMHSKKPLDHLKGKKNHERKRRDEQDQHEQEELVRQLFTLKKPNFEELLQLSRKQDDKMSKAERIRKVSNEIQLSKDKLIKYFNSKLNLTPKVFIQNFNLQGSQGKKNFLTNNDKNLGIRKITQNKPIQNYNTVMALNEYLTPKQFKQIYLNGAFAQIKDPRLLESLIRFVQQNPKSNFLLNLIYEQINRNLVKPKQVSTQIGLLKKVLQSTSQSEYENVNPLKLYWSILKMSPSLKSDYSHLMLKELNKLRINGKRAQKLFKSYTYFFLEPQLSIKIVSKILETSSTLSQVAHLWFSVIQIISRIKSVLDTQNVTAKVNFNDIFGLYRQNKDFGLFFKNQLPKLLYHEASADIFQVYQKALICLNSNPNDLEGLTVGNLQKKLGFKEVILDYMSINDPIRFMIYYPQFEEVKSPSTQQENRELVAKIMKGQYHHTFSYYLSNILDSNQPKDIQSINNLIQEAQNLGFQEQNIKAFYILKQLFKNSKQWVDNETFVLTEDRYQSSFIQNLQTKQSGYPYKRSFRQLKQQQQQLNNQQSLQASQKIKEAQQGKKIFKKTDPERPKKGLFSKTAQKFSSFKQIDQQKLSKLQSDQHYENYLKAAKQAEQNVETKVKEPVQSVPIFNFNKCNTVQEVDAQFKQHINQVNGQNFDSILNNYRAIPLVGHIKNLIKYHFYMSKTNESIPSGLQINITSSFGDIQKNYGDYLKGCSFMFPFSNQFYFQLLNEQLTKMNRHQFKRIAAHMLLFKKQITQSNITLICEICAKEKIGLTLLEIITLINIKDIKINYSSLKKIAATIQHFKGMEKDLLLFLKNYCNNNNLQIQTKLFEPYISNLVSTQRYQPLNAFLQILRYELKHKQYQINKKLSPDENIAAQKKHKQKQTQRLNTQLFEMVKIASKSFKPRTTIPPFLTQILDLYLSKKTSPMKAIQYGTSLILYSQSEDKFYDLLQKIKSDPAQNNQIVLESVIQALLLFGKNIKGQAERVLKSTLYQKQHDLNEAQLKNFGLIFKNLDIPGAYSQYLQYILRKQPKISSETKSLYYKIFNMTTDDSSKNQLSGLLDFIFNPSREKQRIQYKNIKIEEQRKQKIIKNLNMSKSTDETKNDISIVQQIQKKKKLDKTDSKTVNKQKKKEKKEKKLKNEQKQEKQQKGDKQKSQDPSKSETSGKQAKQKDAKQTKQLKQNKQISETKQKSKSKMNLQKAMLAKAHSVLSYDQNKRANYTPKLWKKDERKQSIKMLSSTFLMRFEDDYQPETPQLKTRRGGKFLKSDKQDKKQTSKSTSKQPAKKQATAKKK